MIKDVANYNITIINNYPLRTINGDLSLVHTHFLTLFRNLYLLIHNLYVILDVQSDSWSAFKRSLQFLPKCCFLQW